MAKILFVEDDVALAASVRDWLSSDHHLVEWVANGSEGWDRVRTGGFDLVILDWNLPQISGIEILRNMRNLRLELPVLMLTGKQAINERTEGLDSGADDYLTKPFSMKELSSRVRALLRRSHRGSGNLLQVADLILDQAKYRVTKSGAEIHLQPTDFRLLEFFMRYPDQVFTAEAILQRVWQSDSEATTAALRTAIKRLRQKIDLEATDDANSLIETLPRIGYRMRLNRPK